MKTLISAQHYDDLPTLPSRDDEAPRAAQRGTPSRRERASDVAGGHDDAPGAAAAWSRSDFFVINRPARHRQHHGAGLLTDRAGARILPRRDRVTERRNWKPGDDPSRRWTPGRPLPPPAREARRRGDAARGTLSSAATTVADGAGPRPGRRSPSKPKPRGQDRRRVAVVAGVQDERLGALEMGPSSTPSTDSSEQHADAALAQRRASVCSTTSTGTRPRPPRHQGLDLAPVADDDKVSSSFATVAAGPIRS